MNTPKNDEPGPTRYPLDAFPHARALGLRLEPQKDGGLHVRVPYDERLIGDPATGVIHGGVVTTLLDTGCGIAAMLKMGQGGRRDARPPDRLHAPIETGKGDSRGLRMLPADPLRRVLSRRRL